MTTREKFHQLICLYELGKAIYRDGDKGSWWVLEHLYVDHGLCLAINMLSGKMEHGFLDTCDKRHREGGYFWPRPKIDNSYRTNLRALQVRLNWLYEQLNKLK